MRYGDDDQSNSGGFRERRGGRFGGDRDGNRGGGFSPVKVGEEIDVTIEAVGEKGDGIAKKNGFVIFVPGVQQGDVVKIRITKVFRKMAFAEVIGEGQAAPAAASEEKSEEEKSEAPAEEEKAESEEETEEEAEDETEDSEEF